MLLVECSRRIVATCANTSDDSGNRCASPVLNRIFALMAISTPCGTLEIVICRFSRSGSSNDRSCCLPSAPLSAAISGARAATAAVLCCSKSLDSSSLFRESCSTYSARNNTIKVVIRSAYEISQRPDCSPLSSSWPAVFSSTCLLSEDIFIDVDAAWDALIGRRQSAGRDYPNDSEARSRTSPESRVSIVCGDSLRDIASKPSRYKRLKRISLSTCARILPYSG